MGGTTSPTAAEARQPRLGTYVGVFLVTLSTLMLEFGLTRI